MAKVYRIKLNEHTIAMLFENSEVISQINYWMDKANDGDKITIELVKERGEERCQKN